MRLGAAVFAAVLVVFVVVFAPAHRVDLGRDAGYLIVASSGEPDQLCPQKTSAYFSPRGHTDGRMVVRAVKDVSFHIRRVPARLRDRPGTIG